MRQLVTILFNFLNSGHMFSEFENDIKYKVLFLNSVIGFAILIAGIMSVVRLISDSLLMGFIDILFVFIFTFSLSLLRRSKHKVEFVSYGLILSAYILFTFIYILAENQLSRLALFYLLLASIFFLKGKKIGFYWLVIISSTMIIIHFTELLATQYSGLDIFTLVVYLIALYFIMSVYEKIKESQRQVLHNLSSNLEITVKQRALELEEANIALIKEKEKLEVLSMTDQLTGLANRHRVDSIFNSEVAQAKRYKTNLSLILLDIDFFKTINDTFGHNAGDQFLKDLSQLLQTFLRAGEYIIRWGGEEFVIIIPKANLTEAQRLAQRIRKEIESYDFGIAGTRTASFGVADFRDGDSIEQLISKADSALYKAKENGRNCVFINE